MTGHETEYPAVPSDLLMPNEENPHPRQDEPLDSQVCWELLQRVAASGHLQRASRLRELLLYVGQRSLRDGCDHLPEQELGVAVFGRSDTYDNANDSIVRTTISSLRKRIDAYFAAEGLHEPIIMDIPRGSYIPVFYRRNSQSPPTEDLPIEIAPTFLPASEPDVRKSFWIDNGFRWGAGAVIVALIAVTLSLWHENREAQRLMTPWKYEPALSSVWSNFFAGHRDTDVVMEDSSVLLVQLIGNQNIAMSDYINKSFPEKSPHNNNPERDRDLLLVSHKTLGKQSDFRVGLDIQALDPQNPKLHFYNAREYTPQLLQKDNVILLGSPTSNPWYQWFEGALNFTELPETTGSSPVINRSPKAGEKATYTSQETSSDGNIVAHCVIAYLPKPDHSGDMLLIQGATSEATEAGGRFLMSEESLADFANQLHVKRLPYFEVLLHVSQVVGSAVTSKVEAYRTYPSLNSQ